MHRHNRPIGMPSTCDWPVNGIKAVFGELGVLQLSRAKAEPRS